MALSAAYSSLPKETFEYPLNEVNMHICRMYEFDIFTSTAM